MYNLLYTEEAKSFIEKLPVKRRRQIKDAVERIAGEPALGKRLTHELSCLWSYRSGDYRIIYRVEHQKVLIIVLAVGHRRDIYKTISRRINTGFVVMDKISSTKSGKEVSKKERAVGDK